MSRQLHEIAKICVYAVIIITCIRIIKGDEVVEVAEKTIENVCPIESSFARDLLRTLGTFYLINRPLFELFRYFYKVIKDNLWPM